MKSLFRLVVFVLFLFVAGGLVPAMAADVPPLFKEGGPFTLEKQFGGKIRGLLADSGGRLWVLSGTDLYSYDGTTWKTWDAKAGLASKKITCLMADTKGRLWVGTGSNMDWSGNGVFVFDGSSWKQYTTKDGLSSNVILTLYADPSGTVWAGAHNGICRFDGATWTTVVKETPRWWMRLFQADTKGRLFVGEFDGLALWDGNTFSRIDKRPVTAMALDRDGNLYIGHYMGLVSTWTEQGLATTELGTGLRALTTAPVNTNYYFRFAADPKGGMWASSARPITDLVHAAGLFHFDGKAWIPVPSGELKLSPTLVFGLLMDGTGKLWVIGLNATSRYDGTAWTSLPAGQVNYAIVDSVGNLWVTSGMALYKAKQ
jgi:ligand-binding sensor domain-containing protein